MMRGSWLLVAALAVGCGGSAMDEGAAGTDLAAAGRHGVLRDVKTTSGPYGSGNVAYHGGAVILGTTNVYFIWYGNWNGNTATSVLADWASNIGGSPYYNLNTTYYDGTGASVSNSVRYGGSTTDAYSQGTSIDDAGVQAIVANAINSGALPLDTNALYFVLTSADVMETSGFCTGYCGWHTNATINGASIKYSFVGNPDQCPSACEAQTTSPNGNAGADAMASVMSHELNETVTDPLANAWYDSTGYESSDKCAWSFGSTYKVKGGAKANMKLGSRDYYIQQNWNRATAACALQ